MNLFKKFYEAAEGETSGGGETAIAEPIEKKEEPMSFAQAMAKEGRKTTKDSPAEKQPIVNKTENKEEPKAVEKGEKVETTTTTSNAEKANSESLPPKEEKKEEVKPTIPETSTTSPSWQEVLKSQQPDSIFKELGFDDNKVKFIQKIKELDPKMLAFLDKWENKGDVIGYLKELTTDYSKMSPEEVMRHQLQEEYPKANAATLNALYKKKIVEAYNLDSEDTEQAEEGKMLLEAEADKYRDKFTARQQEKLLPPPPEVKAPEPDRTAERQQQEFEAYMSTVNKDPYAEKVFENKKIVIGKGEDKFSMQVDPEAVKNALFDSEKWTETQFQKIKQPDGSFKYIPKTENQILTAQFALDPHKFINDILQHGKSIGSKTVIDPINNAKPPEGNTVSNSSSEPSTLVEGMAKGGRIVRGGM